MNFQNKHFQQFIRMKDSEVKKLLTIHPKSARYFFISDEIQKIVGKTKKRWMLDSGDTYTPSTLELYQLTFDRYVSIRNEYKLSFFQTIGAEATLKFIERRAKFYYGEENVSLDLLTRNVIIKFPEITITNSIGDSHVMKDIFINIYAYSGKFYDISIARTTVNENEYDRYIFSHTNEYRPGNWCSSLCLGNTDLAEWKQKATSTNNFVYIDRFIASLEGYLSWESLEGKPYKYLAGIKTPQIQAYGGNISVTEVNDSVSKCLKLIYNSNLKLDYKTDYNEDGELQIKIVNRNDIDDLLKNDLIMQFYRYQGCSYTRVEKKHIDTTKYASKVVFKNEIVPIVIESVENELVLERGCHIAVLNNTIEQIEKDLLNYLIKKENE